MFAVRYEVHFIDKFDCKERGHAVPDQKHHHLLSADAATKTPHCKVDAIVGTRGNWLQQTASLNYEGHAPDAPVFLKSQRLRLYDDGLRVCSDVWRRSKAVLQGAIWGACAGLTAGGFVLGTVALLHLGFPATLGVVHLGRWVLRGLFLAGVGALLGLMSTRNDWNQARDTFAGLSLMTRQALVFHRPKAQRKDYEAAEEMCQAFASSDDWVLQQARYELDAIATAWAYKDGGEAKAA